jgi:hypothetical protein
MTTRSTLNQGEKQTSALCGMNAIALVDGTENDRYVVFDGSLRDRERFGNLAVGGTISHPT